ncbi:MAG TPA: pantoate--beta-alanine ligase [Gammaproteobacteria bacterium]|jgi:pantoate--beta-alanine ligase|nr:pantoate--beta-alanine ligase [Gammaproteobacteria bacterium]
MNIVTKVKDWREIKKNLEEKSIGFVPTMGNLHEGHGSLFKRAKAENEIVVASIFVNPTQFNQNNDFIHYPRTLEQDILFLKSHSVDYLFLPDVHEIYPDDYQLQMTENMLSLELEGEHRPGHFNGMLTVVLKLFNIIQAGRAYFGEKDYQQLLLVEKMVRALFLTVQIVPCETVRAEDSLALSSRNSRLNASQRLQAAHFPRLLQSKLSCIEVSDELKKLGFKVDYIVEKWQRRLGAVWLDDIRLIDNFSL